MKLQNILEFHRILKQYISHTPKQFCTQSVLKPHSKSPGTRINTGFPSSIFVPGHTTLSSKGKIQYPHYPHIPQQSHTAKPSGTAAQFHSTFRSVNPDNPTSIASHITVSSYTATLSQCHFRSIIQSIPHTLQHQEISTFRSVTHALVVSQQTHAVMFRLLLFYTESCKIPRRFLQLWPISRCLFTPHFI